MVVTVAPSGLGAVSTAGAVSGVRSRFQRRLPCDPFL
jgi:hypothetical protein